MRFKNNQDCKEGDREEKSLSGRLLAPRATDEWLNEVPVGILKQASIHCRTALDYKAVFVFVFQHVFVFAVLQCTPNCISLLLHWLVSLRWQSNMTDMRRRQKRKQELSTWKLEENTVFFATGTSWEATFTIHITAQKMYLTTKMKEISWVIWFDNQVN